MIPKLANVTSLVALSRFFLLSRATAVEYSLRSARYEVIPVKTERRISELHSKEVKINFGLVMVS